MVQQAFHCMDHYNHWTIFTEYIPCKTYFYHKQNEKYTKVIKINVRKEELRYTLFGQDTHPTSPCHETICYFRNNTARHNFPPKLSVSTWHVWQTPLVISMFMSQVLVTNVWQMCTDVPCDQAHSPKILFSFMMNYMKWNENEMFCLL